MSAHQWILDVMSGRAVGVTAGVARTALRAVEPAYVAAIRRRNARFDRHEGVRHLPKPVLSVGNLTTGGTGKTPAVQWVVRTLQSAGHKPGVLLRGYRKADQQSASDEEALIRTSLAVPVVANPDRYEGGTALLAAHPETTVFVLDDGFQHRKLARALDIVLIDATNPFGFGHVLPRGLLREPLDGLSRAGLIFITRSDQASPSALEEIEATIRKHQPTTPILHANHHLVGFRRDGRQLDAHGLRGAKAVALSGLGNPAAFERTIRDAGIDVVDGLRFPDHHPFTNTDVRHALDVAKRAGAFVVTTEKDWTKLATLPVVREHAQYVAVAQVSFGIDPAREADAVAAILAAARSEATT